MSYTSVALLLEDGIERLVLVGNLQYTNHRISFNTDTHKYSFESEASPLELYSATVGVLDFRKLTLLSKEDL